MTRAKASQKGAHQTRAPHALIENLEDRRLMAASPLQVVGINIAKRVDVDGTALNSNRITLAFGTTNSKGKVTYGSISVADQSKIRSFGYAEDLLNPGQQRKVFATLTASVDSGEPHVLTIITDRLVRKGGRLFLDLGGVKDTSNNDIVYDGSTSAKTITYAKGQNKPRYTLANRNWRPTDLSYFSKTIFTAAPTPATASTEPSSGTIRTALLAFMNQKVSKGIITQAKANSAMALYDVTGDIANLLHNPNIRAGLASLYGTVAEPVIASYTSKKNASGAYYINIEFSSSISASAPVGETRMSPSGRLITYIRPTFAGEDFRAISAVLAHEAMHQDATSSGGNLDDTQDEEIIANAVQANVYIQQAMVDSSFVGNGTVLVNDINDQVLAL
ncbi:MAG: hypothetical protein H7144_09070, partial [Burkholderiales bacterium]|nr:hypothetical protein [Phycisphaerae bacterium]